MNLNIREELFGRLEEYQKETSYKSLNELVEYILESFLKENVNQTNQLNSSSPDEINQRLKDLGYL